MQNGPHAKLLELFLLQPQIDADNQCQHADIYRVLIRIIIHRAQL